MQSNGAKAENSRQKNIPTMLASSLDLKSLSVTSVFTNGSGETTATHVVPRVSYRRLGLRLPQTSGSGRSPVLRYWSFRRGGPAPHD